MCEREAYSEIESLLSLSDLSEYEIPVPMVKSNKELFELIDKNKNENKEQELEKKKREEFLDDFRKKREDKRKEKLKILQEQQREREERDKREREWRDRELRQKREDDERRQEERKKKLQALREKQNAQSKTNSLNQAKFEVDNNYKIDNNNNNSQANLLARLEKSVVSLEKKETMINELVSKLGTLENRVSKLEFFTKRKRDNNDIYEEDIN